MPKALEDVTVLDFSHLLQGPFATQLLGDMGANIIKVERPGQGDLFRTMTFKDRWVGGSESPNFLAWNRNKRSLAIDLKAPEAKAALYRIGETGRRRAAQFPARRDGAARLRLRGFQQALNPRIIYCSGSGYGDSGPYVEPPGPGHAAAGADRPRGGDRPPRRAAGAGGRGLLPTRSAR